MKIDTFTVTTAQWLYNGIYWVGSGPNNNSGYFSKYFDRAIPRLTSNFLQNNGLTLVYFTSQPEINATTFSPVPFTFNVFPGYFINLAYETPVGKIRLHFFLSKGSVDAPQVSTYNVA